MGELTLDPKNNEKYPLHGTHTDSDSTYPISKGKGDKRQDITGTGSICRKGHGYRTKHICTSGVQEQPHRHRRLRHLRASPCTIEGTKGERRSDLADTKQARNKKTQHILEDRTGGVFQENKREATGRRYEHNRTIYTRPTPSPREMEPARTRNNNNKTRRGRNNIEKDTRLQQKNKRAGNVAMILQKIIGLVG